MRMGAFLGDRRRLHQLAIDVPIDLGKRVNDLLRIILRDDGNGFLFPLWGLEAVAGNRRRCFARVWFRDWSHRLGRQRSRQLWRNRSRRFFRDHLCGFFGDRFSTILFGLLLGTLFVRDYLPNILLGLLLGTGKIQR